MAALVQSYPQQSATVTMLQTRPSSASGILPTGQPQGQQYGGSQPQRNSFYGPGGSVGGPTVYRSNTGPIQPYAFTATPSLHQGAQWQQGGGYRATSSPTVPTTQSSEGHIAQGRSRYQASTSMTSLPNGVSTGYTSPGVSRDDSTLPLPLSSRRYSPVPRPQSAYMAGATTATATQVTFTQGTPIKVSPERYRRPASRVADVSESAQQQSRLQASAQPSGSGMFAVNHLYNSLALPEQRRSRTPSATTNRPTSLYSSMAVSSNDDMFLYCQPPPEEIKRLRRRSMPTLDSTDFSKHLTSHDFKRPEASPRMEQLASAPPATKGQSANNREQKPVACVVVINGHGNNGGHTTSTENNKRASSNGSAESLPSSSRSSLPSSSRSSSRPPSSANRGVNVSAPTGNPAVLTSIPDQSSPNQDYPRLVNIPPRSSSSDASQVVPNPSPLSRPAMMSSEPEVASSSGRATSDVTPPQSRPLDSQDKAQQRSDSPAVQQLAAISQKSGKPKSKTSRLRRAFSFGSAAELKKAGMGPDTDGDKQAQANGVQSNSPSKLQKEPGSDAVYDAEQARIAQQQEEAGIGNSIYAGAKIFSGSTDNLSISSTASSASIMIRKMGRGMKKSTRSLVGLFRPKSVIGSPSADAKLPEASQAAVSMVTVEAERERVNVNADPRTQHGGGTGFPRLERNSIDASKAGSVDSDRLDSSGTDNSATAGPRKSIVGGEKERAEVLAAVRKGILKRRGGSPSPPRGNAHVALPGVPRMSESPSSSAPSTPNDDVQGHKRNGSVAIGSEDYFVAALRLRQDTKSAPATPQGSTPRGTMKRNATFSPRIVFYDTWPSQEYDRRGEIATCNRLTPMLAQQIKEELNSFKMEMEVHENSKIYTHFF